MSGRCAAILAGLALASCQSAPVPLSPPSPDIGTRLALAEFPGAASVLSGFDARQEDTAWTRGDQVLFGLRLRKGDTVHRWLLHLRVLEGALRISSSDEKPHDISVERHWTYVANINNQEQRLRVRSTMRFVAVRVHDATGTLLGKSTVQLPSQLLGHGLLRAIEGAIAMQRADESGKLEFQTEEQVRPIAEGLISLIALLNVVQKDDVLADYFWQVVQKPSLWSILTSFGVKASLTASFEKSVPIHELPEHLPPPARAYGLPLRVDVNDTPALLADVVAIDPARPYGLCGGIIAASARHPSQDDVRFDVVLLAARTAKETRVNTE